jgi:hypothetical protein
MDNKKPRCEKLGCVPRINKFGVSWCTECGKLFTFNTNHKALHKNFLINKNEC